MPIDDYAPSIPREDEDPDPSRHGEQGSLARNHQSPPGQLLYPIPYGWAKTSGAIAAMGLCPYSCDPLSPPLLVRGQRLMNWKAAERLCQHQRILQREPNTLRHRR